ncbi:MAG: nitroreductase family protein [Phycisphaerales bacterium]|nr:nitroreductase family protein [Phycisphaerales bacterium]
MPNKSRTRVNASDHRREELLPLDVPKGAATGSNRTSASRGASSRAPIELPALKPEHFTPGSAWDIDEDNFPRAGSVRDQLLFCVRYAVLAPSSHNAQPWKFKVGASHVEIYPDRSRALPVVDPHDRELTISVGCALHHLCIAMQRFGMKHQVELLPSSAEPDMLARVRVSGIVVPGPHDQRIFDGLRMRRTTRTRFRVQDVPRVAIEEFVRLASSFGVTFQPVETALQRTKLAKLIAEADLLQFESRQFRRELAMWMHHNRTHTKDGMPGFAMGFSELESLIAPLVVRTFDVGRGKGAADEHLVMHSPLLAVLGSPHDRAQEWLNTGQALSAILCRAAAWGITASYLNQPVELPSLRPHLRKLVPEAEAPQIVLRMGYVLKRPPHTPRRDVKDALIPMV